MSGDARNNRKQEKGGSVTATTADTATQIYSIFIRTTPEELWQAITTPEFTAKYFYGARISITADGYQSLGPDESVWGETDVSEYEPPRRLVHGWRSLYDADMAAEAESRVTWEIEPQDGGYCQLTVTHDQLEHSPKTADSVSGAGWMMVLSGLKTLLETGEPLVSAGGGA
jgi:uncharacterized protein YndB with AHSA1/START domain